MEGSIWQSIIQISHINISVIPFYSFLNNLQLGNSLVTWSGFDWEMEEHYLVEDEGRVWYNEWHFLFWTTRDWHPHSRRHTIRILPIHSDNSAINNCCHYWMSGPKDRGFTAIRPARRQAKIDSITNNWLDAGESKHVTYMMKEYVPLPCPCPNRLKM